MSTTTKIFGLRIPLDPKVLLGALFGVALLLVWFNFVRGGDDAPTNAARPLAPASPPSGGGIASRSLARRDAISRTGKQGTLRMRPVDATRGDVDPTLKLWLLDRVRSVQPLAGGRNLFEIGPDLAQLPPVPKTAPILPGPIAAPAPEVAGPPPAPVVNIPLRYYGFVKPGLHSDANRGYFIDGENILMATEGDVLQARFLVVALSPNNARLEDMQLRQSQDLPLIPEALPASQ